MTLGPATGMVAVLTTFVLLSCAVAGIGLLFRRTVTSEPLDLDDCFVAFWTGFALLVPFLLCWNFVRPIGWPALATALITGATGLLLNARQLSGLPSREAWRPSVAQFVGLCLAALWVANQSTGALAAWDDGLYHIQAVRWAQAHAVVPGIANLHGPLAFNLPSFLYDAMIDSGWWAGRGAHVANGVIVFVMVLHALIAGGRFLGAPASAPRVNLYRFVMLAPALSLVRNGGVTGYSTDVPVTAVALAAGALMYQLLASDDSRRSPRTDTFAFIAMTILFVTVACLKLSAAVFAGVAVLSMMAWRWWAGRPAVAETRVTLAWMVAIGLLFGVPWLARGVITSGYPFFPVGIGALPVDWLAPLEHARAEAAYVGFTEREFSWHIIGLGWLATVLLSDLYSVLIPVGVVAVAALALVKGGFGLREAARSRGFWGVPAVAVAVVTWFVSAPSTRYGVSLFWTIAAVCVCECHRVRWAEVGTRARRQAVSALVLLGLSPPLVEPTAKAIRSLSNPVSEILAYNVIVPGPDFGLHPIAFPHDVVPYRTDSGVALLVPRQRSEVANKCWDAPLPCTSNPAPNLALRVPGSPAQGFRVQGAWAMRDWPYYWQKTFLAEWRQRQSGVHPSEPRQ